MKKILTLVTVLFMLSASTILAQDLCDSYQMKYQVCVEKKNAGKNLDIDECKTYTDQTTCEGQGCYWYAEKSRCVIDMCLGDTDMNGKVVGADKANVNRDYGRSSSMPTTPTKNYGLVQGKSRRLY